MFITFEGIEGSGKGTVLAGIAAWLRGLGVNVLCTREPGGSPLGRELRSLLLHVDNSGICPQAELFLYLADRAQHVRELIAPTLEKGVVVLSDRYADSTIVYQGYGRGLDLASLFTMNNLAVNGLWPDLTLVLDLEVETGLNRARARNNELGLEAREGRFELERLDFHQKVRRGYQEWAAGNSERMRLVDASGTPEEVFDAVAAIIGPLLGVNPGRQA